jgi:2'-5' RNA ligase
MIRAFIAIKIPEDILDQITQIQNVLRGSGASVKWVEPENIHLTLKFLGDILEPQVEEIARVMQESTEGVCPFQISISQVGAFPNLRYPRVIWVGVQDVQEALHKIQHRLENGLNALGFAIEEGVFKPHITLGRVKSQKNKSNLLRTAEPLVNAQLGTLRVTHLYLFQSDLKPTGSEYIVLRSIDLKSRGQGLGA